MRDVSLALLALSIAACDCASYPASGHGDDGDDEPPGAVTCAVAAADPVPLHELAAARAIGFQLSSCGHLLARVDEAPWLAEPDLAALSPLPTAPGWVDEAVRLAPAGDLLLRTGRGRARVRDLATGAETLLGPGDDLDFLPSHDLRRSILRRCTPDGLAAVDRGVERLVVPGADCGRHTWTAWLAPLSLAVDDRERLVVADLERGTVLDPGLTLSAREEPTPEGEPAYRADVGFLSADGARLVHMQRWEVFRGDTIDHVGPDELRVVETDGGATATYPALARDVVIGFFRSGFAWRSDWERTHLAGAGGLLDLDRRCEVRDVSSSLERVLLSCYHESGPGPWQDALVDTRDLSVRDLGDAWSVRVLSGTGTAIAGCPTDAWRGGCTVPTVRRWVEGEGLRDVALDRPVDVAWVGDDGAVLALATAGNEGLLVDARGQVVTRFPLAVAPGETPRVQAVRDVVLVVSRGGSLEVVAPATGAHARLAEVVLAAETDGRRVAFTVPDGDGVRLIAGALPR